LHDNTSLSQLDISHNGIKNSERNYFAEKLTNNHTLIGLHLSGNEMKLDISGNIIKENEKKNFLHFQSEGLEY